jgi:hypothetical protein
MSDGSLQEILRDAYISLFFKGETLQRVLSHISNTTNIRYIDPITHTCIQTITHPIQFAMNEQGVCPFKKHPTMIYPFALMNEEQLAFLTEIQLEENRSSVSVHNLMGGGRMLLFWEGLSQYYIPHSEVLIAMCRAILGHTQYHFEQRLQSCNIILQRVAAVINLSNSTLKQVNDGLREQIIEIQRPIPAVEI